MAGEWSKKIGEEGEQIATKLMKIIGWGHLQKGLDIPCVNNELHDRKKAHGLDGLFSYNSPLHDRLLRHVCISVKYHDEKYPTGVKSLFKDHIKKLDATIECFDDSEIRVSANNLWESGIDKDNAVGLLIWLHGDRSVESDDDLIGKFEDIRITSDVELKHPIVLLDQKHADFIFEGHEYVKRSYSQHQVSFNYHRTGQNNFDDELISNGDILPWELLSSGLIVFRAVRQFPDERGLDCISIDKFDEEGFKRLLSLAQQVSSNLANQIEICFPDYVEMRHGNTVNGVKSSFQDSSFTNGIKVKSYKIDVRNL